MAWDESSLQARFSGATQYLKAAAKYELLAFDGEMPQGSVIASRSLDFSRHQLIAAVLRRPKLMGVSMEVRELVERILGPEFEAQVAQFERGRFEELFPPKAPAAGAPTPAIRRQQQAADFEC